MKKFLAILILILPITSYAGGSFITIPTESCYQLGVDTITAITATSGNYPQLRLSSDPDETHQMLRYNDYSNGTTDLSRTPVTGDIASFDYGGIPVTFPFHVYYINAYNATDGFIGYESVDFIIQDEECTTPEPSPIATSTATSTASLGDISFGLAIIITLISLGLVGLTFNALNKKK